MCADIVRSDAEQRSRIILLIQSGIPISKAAAGVFGGLQSQQALSDLMRDPAIVAAIDAFVHRDIITTGKALAWEQAQKLMLNKKTPAATRWSAIRWTLEAAGEGIGSSRKNKNRVKDLLEMNREELQQFVGSARAMLDSNLIDVTPSPPSDSDPSELF